MRPDLRHSLRNWAHSILLLGGMVLIAWISTAAIAGSDIALWVIGGFALALLFTPATPKRIILSLYRARLLAPIVPEAAEIVRRLSARADLPRVPQIYYVPSAVPNAFAVGDRVDSAIAVTDGMLRLLDVRELAAVLAHEVSHIANRDLWIMSLADAMARLTMLMAYAGQFLLLVNLPLVLVGAVVVPWIAPVVLILSPTLMALLQLALSRSREYDADLGAARLTGDPLALASALVKLERRHAGWWETILLPGQRIPEPSILRTHPATADRVARLRALARDHYSGPSGPPSTVVRIPVRNVDRQPRLHWNGLWY